MPPPKRFHMAPRLRKPVDWAESPLPCGGRWAPAKNQRRPSLCAGQGARLVCTAPDGGLGTTSNAKGGSGSNGGSGGAFEPADPCIGKEEGICGGNQACVDTCGRIHTSARACLRSLGTPTPVAVWPLTVGGGRGGGGEGGRGGAGGRGGWGGGVGGLHREQTWLWVRCYR